MDQIWDIKTSGRPCFSHLSYILLCTSDTLHTYLANRILAASSYHIHRNTD